jgi:hypothetical protein
MIKSPNYGEPLKIWGANGVEQKVPKFRIQIFAAPVTTATVDVYELSHQWPIYAVDVQIGKYKLVQTVLCVGRHLSKLYRLSTRWRSGGRASPFLLKIPTSGIKGGRKRERKKEKKTHRMSSPVSLLAWWMLFVCKSVQQRIQRW